MGQHERGEEVHRERGLVAVGGKGPGRALAWFRDSMKELIADVDAWEQASLSTSFPG
jgi:hypothetical protein